MFRMQLTRFAILAGSLAAVGCSNTCGSCGGGGLFSSDRPPLFSRFRTTSQPVVVSQGDCCDGKAGTITGPYLPAVPPPGLPPQGVPALPPGATQPMPTIPRIDENGREVPWDGKTSSRPGIKTGNVSGN